MIQKFLPVLGLLSLLAISCNKSSTTTNTTDFATLESQVISDFTSKTALPQYDSLVSKATALDAAIATLSASTTDANLAVAQTAWKNVRTVWEQCEGFLIGPVEANDYDPNTDTWPTDYVQMDSLLNSSSALGVSDVQGFQQSLRGYHPIEFLLFRDANDKARTASSFTTRQMQYLVSLSQDMLKNNITPLLQSWTAAGGYAQTVLNAGKSGNTIYPTKQSFFLDIVGDNGMAGICNEVGAADPDGKMYSPFFNRDSLLTESPYSNNSLIDFKNNIIGLQNVYLGLNGGTALKDLVANKNKDLDNRIQTQMTAAINSFANITERYEQAIFDQRVQVQATMSQLQALQVLLAGELTTFIKTNVQD